MNKILVTGSTGVLGTAIVEQLQTQGVKFLTISRKPQITHSYDADVVNRKLQAPWQRADLVTGQGITQALTGIQTVLHLASSMENIGKEPSEVIAARNLLESSRKAGIEHFIYISIVGIDKIPFSYYAAKLKVEKMIGQSGIPFSVLRATQFHNFMEFQISKMMRLPVGLVPKKLQFQPIQVEAIASELIKMAQHGPENGIRSIGGPQVMELRKMAQLWLSKQGIQKPIIGLPAIGSLMHAFKKGYGTCQEVSLQSNTWEEYLTEKYTKYKLDMEVKY